MRARLEWLDRLERLTPLLGLALFGAALWVLHRELAGVELARLTAAASDIPARSLALTALLTALNYAVLTQCDQLAFVYLDATNGDAAAGRDPAPAAPPVLARRRPSYWRIGLASFIGYAISNSLGFALLTGSSARYRFYARWGLTAHEISRIVLFYSTTFWLGLLVLGGWSLLILPIELAASTTASTAAGIAAGAAIGTAAGATIVTGAGGAAHASAAAVSSMTTIGARAGGLLLLALALAYAVLPYVRRRPIAIAGLRIDVPPPRLVFAQFVVSIVDWLLAVGVLYALMPAPRPPFVPAIAAFLGAQLLALVSHVPGGLGVFESLMVIFLKPFGTTADALLPSLLVFRAIYYVGPLAAALGLLVADELRQRRSDVRRWGHTFGTLTTTITPTLLAAFTFLAGAVLLFSGATPADAHRLGRLSRVVPLPLVELSHFAGSLIGLGLLLVSQGLARRLDLAYYLATAGLALGIVASLLKGGDYEEAIVLATVLALFLPTRRDFDRRASFFESRFSPGWMAAVIAVIGASVWLGLFAFRHVEYANDLWWQFALRQDVSRYLRASFGVTLALALFGVTRLLLPARAAAVPPSDEALTAAAVVIDHQIQTSPNLVFLRDKALLWDDERTAFVMYGVQGRTWVAMGDPVGPPAATALLIRRFLERCDDYDARPVFYEVSAQTLYRYADFGLTFAKLGEEARVPLETFTLDGSQWKPQRQALRRLEREHATFRVVPAACVPHLIAELRDVSDEWLRIKSSAEKGFSLGFFDEAYLQRFPVAVIEQEGRIAAFASLWPSAARVELSVDLMRHRASAPNGVMEALLTEVMRWGRAEGYRWFNLGMAPLAGLDASEMTSLWVKLGSWIHTHGESYYNFQGLRSFKDKFNPVWEPRYMAFPGGLALPRVLADVSALIAGGYRRILFK